ncbi:MAG: transcriptional repressor LexA [Mucispirillum sp.]|nr:transcriptional repressor LexA [Mucispirillum sp.]
MTDKQERLLNFILDFHKEHGYSPSIREMAQGMGVSSPSTIKAMLDRLEAKGMLTKSSGRARSLTAVMQEEEDKGIPVIGRIVAGTPVMAEENIEGYIPVKEFLRNSNGGFFLIVDGYSMQDKGILPGDYVFIQPCKEISNGQIGAFRLNGEVTLKTFKRSEAGIFLLPANEDFEPIPVTEDDTFEVIGRYVMLLRFREQGYHFL